MGACGNVVWGVSLNREATGACGKAGLGGARGECRRLRELVGKRFGIRRGMA